MQEAEETQQEVSASGEKRVTAQRQKGLPPSARGAAEGVPDTRTGFRFAETEPEAGKKERQAALVVSVSDIETGTRYIQEAILEFDGDIIATVSSRDRTIFTAEIDAGRMEEFIKRLEMTGRVNAEDIPQANGEGARLIEIQIVPLLYER